MQCNAPHPPRLPASVPPFPTCLQGVSAKRKKQLLAKLKANAVKASAK